MLKKIIDLHSSIFAKFELFAENWLIGLWPRFVFAAVIMQYYLHSAGTKVSSGFLGFFNVQDAAYFQILPKVIERYNYDASQVPLFPYDIIVYAGTYTEFILPILIIIGLFTRLASIGMIGFIIVQSYVDVMFHGVDKAAIGQWFDRVSDSVIADQRLLWIFLLSILIIKGAGTLSLDRLITRVLMK